MSAARHSSFGCDTICGSGAWGLAKGSLDADGGEEGSIEVDAEVFDGPFVETDDGPFVETDAGEAAVVSGDGEVDKHVLRCGKLLNLIPRSATRLWRLLMELLTLDRSFIMF